jgi:hypothetical protein
MDATPMRTSCRERFSAKDIQFVAETLADSQASQALLAAFLADPTDRDAVLDNNRLLKVLLEHPQPISVSADFYFYVLSRTALKAFDREITDYVASVLASFVAPQSGTELDSATMYVADMLSALNSVSPERAFFLRAQIGNRALFLTGVFPQHLQHRAQYRGAPDIGFYENVGSVNYRLASAHRLARESALGDVYRVIADQFSEVRSCLNQLADRLICLEPIGTTPS